MCVEAGLECAEISYCGGYLSQKMTGLWRTIGQWTSSRAARFAVTLPLRVIPVLFPDRLLTRSIDWPFFSICLEAYKRRF